MKVFHSIDRSIDLNNDIARCIGNNVKHIVDADIALVLHPQRHLKEKIASIRHHSPTIPVMTITNDPSILECDNMIFPLHSRLFDLSVMTFLNYIRNIRHDVVHVDCQVASKGLHLKSEVTEQLLVVDHIHDVSKTTLRFSFNDHNSVHVSGYSDGNFSLSCFVSNCSENFCESFTVYTKSNGIFHLKAPYECIQSSYQERYGAAWERCVKTCTTRHKKIVVNVLSKINGSFAGRRGTGSKPKLARR